MAPRIASIMWTAERAAWALASAAGLEEAAQLEKEQGQGGGEEQGFFPGLLQGLGALGVEPGQDRQQPGPEGRVLGQGCQDLLQGGQGSAGDQEGGGQAADEGGELLLQGQAEAVPASCQPMVEEDRHQGAPAQGRDQGVAQEEQSQGRQEASSQAQAGQEAGSGWQAQAAG